MVNWTQALQYASLSYCFPIELVDGAIENLAAERQYYVAHVHFCKETQSRSLTTTALAASVVKQSIRFIRVFLVQWDAFGCWCCYFLYVC